MIWRRRSGKASDRTEPPAADRPIPNAPNSRPAELVKLVFEQTRRHHNSYGVAAGPDRTWHTLYALESTFDIVRLGFTYDAATDCTVAGAAIAPSASVNDDINPVDATGGPVGWTRVTFGNRGLDRDYGAQLATPPPPDPVGSIMLNKPPDGDDQKMPVTWSDWVPVSSLSRADGETLPLLMVRANLTGSPRPAASSPGAGWDRDFAGPDRAQLRQSRRLREQTASVQEQKASGADDARSHPVSHAFARIFDHGRGR